MPVVNVNSVFGFNLRLLCSLRPSIAEASRELNLTKVQMGRFLNGTATPKPAVLKRVCDNFGVDARILLEKLTPKQIAILKAGGDLRADTIEMTEGKSTHEGMQYAIGAREPFSAENGVKDGFYLLWRWSYLRPSYVVKIPLQVKTLGTARVVKGVDDFRLIRTDSGQLKSIKDREFRGVVKGNESSMTIMFVHGEPNACMGMLFAFKTGFYPSFLMPGWAITGQSEVSSRGEGSSRCVVQYLPDGVKEVLSYVRQGCTLHPDDVDESIMDTLNKPNRYGGQ